MAGNSGIRRGTGSVESNAKPTRIGSGVLFSKPHEQVRVPRPLALPAKFASQFEQVLMLQFQVGDQRGMLVHETHEVLKHRVRVPPLAEERFRRLPPSIHQVVIRGREIRQLVRRPRVANHVIVEISMDLR